MLKPEDTLAFDTAVAELNRATQDLERLEHDPATSLAGLARAQDRYYLSRLEWLRSECQLRKSTTHGVPKLAPLAGPIVIVGHDKWVRDSLSVLLDVKGYGRAKARAFDTWHEVWLEPSQLIVVDVSPFSRGASLLLIEGFDTCTERPHIIALAWPQDVPSFIGKVDEIVPKPVALNALLNAIDRIGGCDDERITDNR
ncbi:response regulator receiver protein [Paraburkholderia sp. CNPSo 3272]|uniref:response regulator receiver protein n=1 Tax=Paraburkholderia sp. CNPSo 3272 TaxID=2940931 RepID=UPI0020B68119|nr:response regulator receiver protein [Paraburkholderia sp. CNPSo 3272]MCP3726272.1 response regulator receiver protein [Paraburkholderia sp. CNPSo 3272]